MSKSNIPLAMFAKVFVLAAFLVTVVPNQASATNLIVVNKSGETVYALYIVPESQGGWGNNILNKSLPNNSRCTVNVGNFNKGSRFAYSNIRADFSGGRYNHWRSVNLISWYEPGNDITWFEITPYRG